MEILMLTMPPDWFYVMKLLFYIFPPIFSGELVMELYSEVTSDLQIFVSCKLF